MGTGSDAGTVIRQRDGLIIDAVVLIDFLESDATLFQLISEHIGTLHVATTTLAEVEQLAEADCAGLGLILVETTLAQLEEATTKTGALSLEDAVTMILAGDNDWICITNDRPLRRKCEEHQIRILWGLETLALLVERQAIPPGDARKIAFRIHQANPMYITRRIYEDFCRRIGVEM